MRVSLSLIPNSPLPPFHTSIFHFILRDSGGRCHTCGVLGALNFYIKRQRGPLSAGGRMVEALPREEVARLHRPHLFALCRQNRTDPQEVLAAKRG